MKTVTMSVIPRNHCKYLPKSVVVVLGGGGACPPTLVKGNFSYLEPFFCSAVPTLSKVMVTTGSPRTSSTKTEIINVGYDGYAKAPCKGYRTFQPQKFQPRSSTPEFSTPDSYGDEDFMVEKPEVEKRRFEMFILI